MAAAGNRDGSVTFAVDDDGGAGSRVHVFFIG